MSALFSRLQGAALFAAASFIGLYPSLLRGQVGNDNPTGPAGVFNGNVTTGCSYDPLTGNAMRSVTDMVVAGGVGSYPLAFSRVLAGAVVVGCRETVRRVVGIYIWSGPQSTVNVGGGYGVGFGASYAPGYTVVIPAPWAPRR